MNWKILIPCSIALLAFGLGHKPFRKEKPATFPANLGDSARTAFVEQFQRGQVLYHANCAGCHNVQVDQKTAVIPDFSLPQLLDYEMRFQYPEHQDRMREVDISAEELDAVQAFLQYRKRSGVPVAPLPLLPPSQRE